MKSFKKRILFSQLFLFTIFILLFFPLANFLISSLVKGAYIERLEELMPFLKTAQNEEELLATLEKIEPRKIFRITLVDHEGFMLYDSHLPKLPEGKLISNDFGKKKEIIAATNQKYGIRKGYSKLFNDTFVYIAKRFVVGDNVYVIRAAFSYHLVKHLTQPLQFALFLFGALFFLLYSLMTGLIVIRMSRPIKHMISHMAISKENNQFPLIPIRGGVEETKEFHQLANAFNVLSTQMQRQIQYAFDAHSEHEAILESLGEGVIAIDGSLCIIFANSVAAKIFQMEPKKVIGCNLLDLLEKYPLLESFFQAILLCFRQNELQRTTLVWGGGDKKYYDVTVSPKAKEKGVIVVIQNKTSDYKIVSLGKDFVANASHELKTPITVIQGFAETLLDLPMLTPKMLKQIAQKIFRTSQRLGGIIKSLLTLAEVDNLSKTHFSSYELNSIIENCREEIMMAHENAQISLRNSKRKFFILADGGLVELAIYNVLENAIRYSQKAAVVDLFIEEVQGFAKIKIKDRGIGIPKEDLKRIFDRFYTVDKARSRKCGGTGLGLSLVKTVVEKHGGKIEIDSQMNRGTSFSLYFPIDVQLER